MTIDGRKQIEECLGHLCTTTFSIIERNMNIRDAILKEILEDKFYEF